jgi:hypothetical protein
MLDLPVSQLSSSRIIMIIVKGKMPCKICGKRDAVIYCDGCESPLCQDCRKFDMWSCGCGHIDTKAFCSTCFDDINVNPWGGKRPIE